MAVVEGTKGFDEAESKAEEVKMKMRTMLELLEATKLEVEIVKIQRVSLEFGRYCWS